LDFIEILAGHFGMGLLPPAGPRIRQVAQKLHEKTAVVGGERRNHGAHRCNAANAAWIASADWGTVSARACLMAATAARRRCHCTSCSAASRIKTQPFGFDMGERPRMKS
jgi:hypothetical protein